MFGKRGNQYYGEVRGGALPLFDSLVHPSRLVSLMEFLSVALLLALPVAFLVISFRSPSGIPVSRLVNGVTGVFQGSGGAAPRQGVLVVTANAARQFDVAVIVQPRGYKTYRERTAEKGMARLRTAPGQLNIVVVDGALPGSLAMVRSIRQSWPDKHVIVLNGPRRPVLLAQSLLNLL